MPRSPLTGLIGPALCALVPDQERALRQRSILPLTDARDEAAFIPHCRLLPIPSLWGHPAGAGASPQDGKFINEHVAQFLLLSTAAAHQDQAASGTRPSGHGAARAEAKARQLRGE